jgi:glycosyltransferase involved in cell wall biosynthesis
VVANSQKAITYHEETNYFSTNFVLIPNFLRFLDQNSTPKYSCSNSDEELFKIGLMSRPVHGKGHVTLLSALTLLNKMGDKFKFKIVFQGYGIPEWDFLLSRIEKEIFGLNIIELREGNNNVEDFYCYVDLVVVASDLWESDSNVALESIIFRKPLLVSDMALSKIEGINFKTFQNGNPVDLAVKILEIASTSKSLYKETLDSNFTILKKSRNTEAILNSWIFLIETDNF